MKQYILPGITIVFVVLKLFGIITWHWGLILFPIILWVILAFTIGGFIYYNLSEQQKDEFDSNISNTKEQDKYVGKMLKQAITNIKNKV